MHHRLQKLMSAAGHCSRRQAEELLRQGRVEVNGRIAGLGDQADPDTDQICVDGTPLARVTAELVLLLNKPKGVILGMRLYCAINILWVVFFFVLVSPSGYSEITYINIDGNSGAPRHDEGPDGGGAASTV